MASLIDLFNPSFLMFLGILVLVVALVVVYFESKFREQNHKFSSMLSLISSLAEELNTTKMVIQDISVSRHPQDAPPSYLEEQTGGEPIYTNTSKLIHVSDGVNIKSDSNLIHVSDDENSESLNEAKKEAEKLAKEAEKQAKKEALEAEKLAKKEALEAEKLAKKEAIEAEKLAKKEA